MAEKSPESAGSQASLYPQELPPELRTRVFPAPVPKEPPPPRDAPAPHVGSPSRPWFTLLGLRSVALVPSPRHRRSGDRLPAPDLDTCHTVHSGRVFGPNSLKEQVDGQEQEMRLQGSR